MIDSNGMNAIEVIKSKTHEAFQVSNSRMMNIVRWTDWACNVMHTNGRSRDGVEEHTLRRETHQREFMVNISFKCLRRITRRVKPRYYQSRPARMAEI